MKTSQEATTHNMELAINWLKGLMKESEKCEASLPEFSNMTLNEMKLSANYAKLTGWIKSADVLIKILEGEK